MSDDNFFWGISPSNNGKIRKGIYKDIYRHIEANKKPGKPQFPSFKNTDNFIKNTPIAVRKGIYKDIYRQFEPQKTLRFRFLSFKNLLNFSKNKDKLDDQNDNHTNDFVNYINKIVNYLSKFNPNFNEILSKKNAAAIFLFLGITAAMVQLGKLFNKHPSSQR